MELTDATAHSLLNTLKGTAAAVQITHMSLHDGYPGTAGLNEIAGGAPAYARKAITFNNAATRNLDSSNTPAFDVPGGTEVQYMGFWTAVSGGTFLGWAAKGFSAVTDAVANAGTDKIEKTAHGYSDNDRVAFFGSSVPTGLTAGTCYFVVNATANDFEVSATLGGAKIDITGAGASWTMSEIVVESFAGQGTYTATDVDISLPSNFS